MTKKNAKTKRTAKKSKIEMVFDEGSMDWKEQARLLRRIPTNLKYTPADVSTPVSTPPAEHAIGLLPQLYMYDLQAVFRDAVQRVQQIYTGRLLGIVESEATRERDRKLLDGELEITVAPGKVVVLLAQPQTRFAPTKVIIDNEASDWYDVCDVKVGKNSQFISPCPIPGSTFRASSQQILTMDTAEISMFLTVELVNVSGRTRRFPRVTMVGHIVTNRSEV